MKKKISTTIMLTTLLLPITTSTGIAMTSDNQEKNNNSEISSSETLEDILLPTSEDSEETSNSSLIVEKEETSEEILSLEKVEESENSDMQDNKFEIEETTGPEDSLKKDKSVDSSKGVISQHGSSLPWRMTDEQTIIFEEGFIINKGIDSIFRLSDYLEKENVAKIESITFEAPVTLINGMDELFGNFPNLKTINNFSYLNGEQVTTSRYVFSRTPNVTTIDWSNQTILWNKMDSFFTGSNVSDVNFTNLNLPITTDLSNLFANCINLSSIKLDGINVPKLKNIRFFISNTPNLTNLNLEHNKLYLPTMSYMFASSNFITANLNNLELPITIDMSSLFYNNAELNNVSMDNLMAQKVDNTSNMFNNTNNLKIIDWSNHTISIKSFRSMFSSSFVEEVNFDNLQLPQTTSIASLFSDNKNLHTVTMNGFNAPRIVSEGAYDVFAYTTNLTHLDWSNHTVNINNADKFFNNSKLISINLNHFNMPITTTTKYFFGSIPSLTHLDIDGFNAPKSKNNYYWFTNVGIQNIDWGGQTLNIPSTKYLFQRSKFQYIKLDNINLPITTELDLMFQQLKDTPNVSMKNLYAPNLKTTNSMFKDAAGIQELTISFEPAVSITNSNYMFSGLDKVEVLDLSTINLGKSLNVIGMFQGMASLKSLTLGDETILENSVSLPEAARDNKGNVIEGYTGNWQTIGTGTIDEPNGKWAGTSSQLIAKSKEGIKETYVWGVPSKVPGAGDIELIHFPSTFDFGVSHSMIKSDQLIDTKQKDHLVIRELRGMTSETNAGNWKLSASASPLSDNKQTEQLDSSVSYLFKTTLKQYENEDDTLPPSSEMIFPPSSEQSESVSFSKEVTVPTDEFTVDIMSASNAPDGRYALELEKTQLRIPKEVKTKQTSYNGNITWILADTI